ncbi:MAG TPA: hypothetical protein VE053_05615 [Allosphingosinicella sp.]|nr:hypothetical protein [Allosphingosinicella sp.]
MRLAFLALALTLPAASSALPTAAPPRLGADSSPPRLCGDDMKARPIRSPEAAKPKRLGELPPGDLTLTLLNRVGDCIEPVVVRQGFGVLGDRPGR